MKYDKWLNEVKTILLSLNIRAFKDKRPYRQFLFKVPLVLDEKSWYSYFEDGFTPRKAVNEDLELPWIEYQKHTILS